MDQCNTKTIRSEEHTSELQSHRDLHSFPTRRSSDLQWFVIPHPGRYVTGRWLLLAARNVSDDRFPVDREVQSEPHFGVIKWFSCYIDPVKVGTFIWINVTRKPLDRKSTRLNSSHTEIYTLSLHDALPISNGS